jgi:hypothetical protein
LCQGERKKEKTAVVKKPAALAFLIFGLTVALIRRHHLERNPYHLQGGNPCRCRLFRCDGYNDETLGELLARNKLTEITPS